MKKYTGGRRGVQFRAAFKILLKVRGGGRKIAVPAYWGGGANTALVLCSHYKVYYLSNLFYVFI